MDNSGQQYPSSTQKLGLYEPHTLETARYDSFLVATAFLVAAYATVMVNLNHNFHMLLLANAVNAIGFYLAIFFTIANFQASLLIRRNIRVAQLHDELQKELKPILSQEKRQEKIEEAQKVEKEVTERIPNSLSKLAYLFLREVIFIDPGRDSRNGIPYIHTWLVPFLLGLFWLIVPFCVTPDRWTITLYWAFATPASLYLLRCLLRLSTRIVSCICPKR